MCHGHILFVVEMVFVTGPGDRTSLSPPSWCLVERGSARVSLGERSTADNESCRGGWIYNNGIDLIHESGRSHEFCKLEIK